MQQTEEMRKIVELALKRFQEAYDADEEQRSLAKDDDIFANDEGGQWDDLAKRRRAGKPMYTINLVAAAIREVIGNYRQNQIEMKALPKQNQAKDEADTYNGLIRAILSNENAEAAKDSAFQGIVVGGFGAARVLNQYTHDNPFEQDIDICPIYDAIETVWFDPKAKHMTGRDGSYVFETTMMGRKEFEEEYPYASLTQWPDAKIGNLQSYWGCGNSSRTADIRIADYYVKEPIKVDKTLLSDGSIMNSEDYLEVADELREKGIEFVDARSVDTYKVMHYKMSGTEILEEPRELPTSRLPIIRCLGYHEWRDGTLHYRGLVRNAKDPARVYNYATSANVEAYALAPKQKVLATPKMIAGHESTWRGLNTSDSPVLTFTPDPEAPDGKPIPFHAVGGSPELIQQAQQAAMDVQATIGRRSPTMGESATDRSGRAILALQRQDDAVTFELLDNLAIFWKQVATVAMDMIPVVYDTERQMMILGDDGQTDVVTLNEIIKDEQTGKEFRRFDTSRRYSIKATVGPAFETKRSEIVNVLTALMQDPEMKPLIGDLFAKNLDFPMSDELTKRIRKIQLKQGIVEPNEEESKEMQALAQTPEAQQQAQLQMQIQQMQIQSQMLQLQRMELENANLQANIANLQAATMEKVSSGAKDNADIQETYTDVYVKQIDAIISQIEKGIPVSQDQMNAAANSLQLLSATQQEEFNTRIQAALNQAQQLQPRS